MQDDAEDLTGAFETGEKWFLRALFLLLMAFSQGQTRYYRSWREAICILEEKYVYGSFTLLRHHIFFSLN